MLRFILAMAIAQGPVTYKMPPNRFDSSEMSSEAVFAGMHVCFEQKGGYSPEKIILCGCLMDAARLNLKQGKSKPHLGATREQIDKCNTAEPKEREPLKKPNGKIGT